MAGDWIKMRMDLQTHPKVVRIMSALRADKFRTIGGLHAVWCVFDAHSEDGVLEGYTAEAMDDSIGWPGFAAAMQSVDWLNETPQGLTMPRFDNHNGKSAKRRASDTERKRSVRTVRNLSACDAEKSGTREEKRREDISLPIGRDNAPAKTQPRFTKPTLEEIELLGTGINAQEFIDFYEANGWKVGQNAMKDWRAAARNWKRRQGQFAGSQHRKPPPTSQQQFAGYTPNSQPEVSKDQQDEVPF
jgi:hypothetical protein